MNLDMFDPGKLLAFVTNSMTTTTTTSASSEEDLADEYAAVPRRGGAANDPATQQVQKLRSHISENEAKAKALDTQIQQIQQQAVQYKMEADKVTTAPPNKKRYQQAAMELMGKLKPLQVQRAHITTLLQTLEQFVQKYETVKQAKTTKSIVSESTRGLEADMAGLQVDEIKQGNAAARIVTRSVDRLDEFVFNPLGLDPVEDMASDWMQDLDALVQEYQPAESLPIITNSPVQQQPQRSAEDIFASLQSQPLPLQQQQKRVTTHQSLY